ncbi:MAG: hypothetical protein ABIO43_12070, partial [Sphingomicrobium sp.]
MAARRALVLVGGAPAELPAADTLVGAADPYARTKLAADFSNSTVTFNTITGFTYTPPANTDFEIEAWLLIQTATATVLPRVGISIGA